MQASPRIRGFGGVARYDYSLSLGVEMFVGFDQTFYPRGLGRLIGRAYGRGAAPPLRCRIRQVVRAIPTGRICRRLPIAGSADAAAMGTTRRSLSRTLGD